MNVGLNVDIFWNATEDTWVGVKYLLYICRYHSRHKLVLQGTVPQNIEDELDEDQISMLKSASAKYINGTPCDCEIQKYGDIYTEQSKFSLDEGIRYLSQPFMIVLENSKNDAMFIETLIECFNKSDLQEAQRNGWLCYTNAGGCSNVVNLIEGMLAQYGGKSKFLRCFVILDSDAFYPGHVNKNSQTTKEYLSNNLIPHHVWEKRMMENYLPIEALPEGEWKNAYASMSPQQKDHYNIVGGFGKDEHFEHSRSETTDRTCLLHDQALYFSTVSDTNYLKLRTGVNLAHVKGTFPLLFNNRNDVNYDTLIQRTMHQSNPNELQDLLNEIVQTMAI